MATLKTITTEEYPQVHPYAKAPTYGDMMNAILEAASLLSSEEMTSADLEEAAANLRELAERRADDPLCDECGVPMPSSHGGGMCLNCEQWVPWLSHCDVCGRCMGNAPCVFDGCDGHQTLHTSDCATLTEADR